MRGRCENSRRRASLFVFVFFAFTLRLCVKYSVKKISIIGGGASGVLLAINLIKNAGNDALEINLIEKSNEVGRGVAYGTKKNFHLLNVPAAKMGAFANDTAHFYHWLKSKNFDFEAGDFVPRKIYGDYLREVFAEAVENKPANVTVKTFRAEAINISTENDAAGILLDSGEKIISDQIILAFGNFLPPHVRTKNDAYTKSAKYFQSPWRGDIPTAIARDEKVLIIGTGLTGIDVILSLFNNEHRGGIYALSTHGLLPTVHAQTQPYQSFQNEIEAVSTARQRLKIVHKHLQIAASENNNFRAVIDSLRPFTQSLWQSFPPVEKRRFMRHLQRKWDVARHRMPPQCAEILDNLQQESRLKILRGRIRRIDLLNDGFQVFYGDGEKIAVDRIINCTGSISNFEKIDVPLIKNLRAAGKIRADELRLGLDATPDGEIIERDGSISPNLLTFGTAHKGILWECTAMPDIRAQAEKLASKLVEHSKSEI